MEAAEGVLQSHVVEPAPGPLRVKDEVCWQVGRRIGIEGSSQKPPKKGEIHLGPTQKLLPAE